MNILSVKRKFEVWNELDKIKGWILILLHSILQILSLDVMGREIGWDAVPVQIPVELLRDIVTIMMIAKVISYVAWTTVSFHFHMMQGYLIQAAAMNPLQVSKE